MACVFAAFPNHPDFAFLMKNNTTRMDGKIMDDKPIKTACLLRSTSVSPDPRLEKSAKWLYELGYQVKILCWDRECAHQSSEITKGIEIIRFRMPGSYGSGIKNVLPMLVFNFNLFLQLLRQAPDYIQACDLDTAGPAYLLQKIKGAFFIYDIYDHFAASRRVGILAPIFRQMENWIVNKCDLLILADERRIAQLDSPKSQKRPMIIIHNSPEDLGDSLKKIYQSPVGPYFAYVGILSADRGLTVAIQALHSNCQVGLVIAGYGALTGMIEKSVQQYQNMRFLGKIQYQDTLAVEGNALALLALYDPTVPNNRYAAPNKLYEAAMLGKPIITSADTQLSETVAKTGIGYVVPYGDIDLLRQACQKIIDQPEEAKQMGIRARALYDQQFAAVKMKARFQKAYEKLAHPG